MKAAIQEKVLDDMVEFIDKYQHEYGKSPSYRVIMKTMKFNGIATVFRYVAKLEAQGRLRKTHLGGIEIPQSLNPSKTIIAPLVGSVACGIPILATENIEGTYSLPSDLFGTGPTFLLQAKGESMLNAGIHDKDILVVRKCSCADDGEIVVALLGDEATVKRLYRKNNKIILHPENERFKDIIVDNVEILGKVISSIHQF